MHEMSPELNSLQRKIFHLIDLCPGDVLLTKKLLLPLASLLVDVGIVIVLIRHVQVSYDQANSRRLGRLKRVRQLTVKGEFLRWTNGSYDVCVHRIFHSEEILTMNNKAYILR